MTEPWQLSSEAMGGIGARADVHEEKVTELQPTVAGKPRELQGWSNRLLFHPLSRQLALALVPTRVTPNMVSVFGALMVVSAGALYALIGTPAAIALGLVLHLGWHVVDGADGQLARMSGRASPSGEIVDGLCDYTSHAIVYTLLASVIDDRLGWTAWPIVVGAGLSRAAQSIFAESGRRTYQWWAYGIGWLQNEAADGDGIGVRLSQVYLAAWRRMSGPTQAVNAAVLAAEGDPARRARIAAIAREDGRRTLPLLAALGANPRTLLLGVSMFLGDSLWFFLLELVVLNIVLLLAIWQNARVARHMLARIAADV